MRRGLWDFSIERSRNGLDEVRFLLRLKDWEGFGFDDGRVLEWLGF